MSDGIYLYSSTYGRAGVYSYTKFCSSKNRGRPGGGGGGGRVN